MNKTLDYYNENAHAFIEKTLNVEFTDMQDAFLRYISDGGYILDLGCGSGRDTKYFLKKGYRVDAVDGSDEMVRLARDYTGVKAKQMLFQDLDAFQTYDGVWACSSILHLDHKELRDVLKKINNALKSDGVLYTSFKYGEFSGERNGRYFTDMNEESFCKLIDSVGRFSTIRLWTTNDVRPGRGSEKWLNVLLRKTE